MTTDEISGKPRVPKEELEELVESLQFLRENQADADSPEAKAFVDGYQRAIDHAKRDLERVVERYE